MEQGKDSDGPHDRLDLAELQPHGLEDHKTQEAECRPRAGRCLPFLKLFKMGDRFTEGRRIKTGS